MNDPTVETLNQHLAMLAGKIREMVMQAELVKQGVTRDPMGKCATIVDMGRTVLARVGQPMPPVPARLAPPVFGTDPRTGMGPAEALMPPTDDEVAVLDAIHHEPSEPIQP